MAALLAGDDAPRKKGEELKPTDPYAVVSRVIGYLENNQCRMDSARYRQQGLPITSSLVDTLVKQFNHRVKGTEKFWNESQAETILQLARPSCRKTID